MYSKQNEWNATGMSSRSIFTPHFWLVIECAVLATFSSKSPQETHRHTHTHTDTSLLHLSKDTQPASRRNCAA